MFWYGMGFSRLGLEEGQVRLACPPGTRKVYLQEFPWEKCVPEDQASTPAPYEGPPMEAAPEPAMLAPVPSPIPPAPPAYKPAGKARFLQVDPTTGQVIDPDTGQPIPMEHAFAFTPVETAGAAVVVVGIVALALAAFGVFGGGGK